MRDTCLVVEALQLGFFDLCLRGFGMVLVAKPDCHAFFPARNLLMKCEVVKGCSSFHTK